MSITYPYKYGNYIVYEGDIGPGLKKQFSLILLLEDSVTGEAPIGRVIVSFKETKKKPFKNLSGAFCFKGLEDGSYTLEIESDNYKPVSKNIIIDAGQNGSTQSGIKIITLQLTPKLSYPFSSVVALYVRIVNKDNQPLEKVRITSRVLHPACFFKSHYDRFINKYQGIAEIMQKYTETIDTKVCVYPEKISPADKQQLKKAFDELVQLSKQKVRGFLNFSYNDYVIFLKEKLIKDKFLTKYESDNGHTTCLSPDSISDFDKQKIPAMALNELNKMSLDSGKGSACFTHKKYVRFLEKYFLRDNLLTQYAEDKNGKIQLDLDEIATDDLNKMPEDLVNVLQQEAEIKIITDENGESVFVFRRLKNRSEKIAVRILDDGPKKERIVDLVEGSTNTLKIIHP